MFLLPYLLCHYTKLYCIVIVNVCLCKQVSIVITKQLLIALLCLDILNTQLKGQCVTSAVTAIYTLLEELHSIYACS